MAIKPVAIFSILFLSPTFANPVAPALWSVGAKAITTGVGFGVKEGLSRYFPNDPHLQTKELLKKELGTDSLVASECEKDCKSEHETFAQHITHAMHYFREKNKLAWLLRDLDNISDPQLRKITEEKIEKAKIAQKQISPEKRYLEILPDKEKWEIFHLMDKLVDMSNAQEYRHQELAKMYNAVNK